MFRFFRLLAPRASDQLPLPVLAELVDLMFAGLAPVLTIGFITLSIGLFIACRHNDLLELILTASSVAVLGFRVLVTLGYRRRKLAAGVVTLEVVRCWQRRFAIGSFAFAVVIGLLALRAFTLGDPYVPMLLSGLVFGYGTGLITRMAVRPAICGVSLLLMSMLTIVGAGIEVLRQDNLYAAIAYLGEIVLIGAFAVNGLQIMMQSYETTVGQLLANRDLAAMAGQDTLTSLPNRLLLRSRFAESLAHSRETGHLVAVHCLDLDRFKAVNDTFGHPAGDALLQAVGKRLVRSLKDGDTAARIGGDEFVVVQGGIREQDEASFLAQRIIRIISAPYGIQGNEVRIGVSIGIAITGPNGGNLEELLARADAALYLSKGQKRGGVAFWGEPPSTDNAIAPVAA